MGMIKRKDQRGQHLTNDMGAMRSDDMGTKDHKQYLFKYSNIEPMLLQDDLCYYFKQESVNLRYSQSKCLSLK